VRVWRAGEGRKSNILESRKERMPTVAAQRELLASREDVWRFLSEPHNFADWWPGIGGVEPDRRGLAPGARWAVRGAGKPGFIRKPDATGRLLILKVEPLQRLAWQFTGDGIDAEIELTAKSSNRTTAVLTVNGPWLIGLRRSLPRNALNRLHALCQTAADLT
jgi:uncharacterized protein YndB with AHSA1/START domain